MPDELDAFLASQDAADMADWEQHIDKRHEARRAARERKQYGRDRSAVVAELESGSDEITAMDNVLAKKDNPR